MVAFIVVVAVSVTGTVLVMRHYDAMNASGQSSQSDEGPDGDMTNGTSTDDRSSDSSSTAPLDIDRESMDALVDGFSTTDAAVSVAAVDGTLVYSSRNATRHMVSAGLYLPVYLAYYGTHERLSDSAGEMMRSMNNEAANLLIDSLGGLDAVNTWLSANQYADTTFSRLFGDIDASNAGYENYASSDDAARMLAAVAASGDDVLMTCDIAAEGVDIPTGATVHAHRGRGMQDAYNYFIVISDGNHDVGVSVMTETIGQKRAAQLTSGVLEAVWAALEAE